MQGVPAEQQSQHVHFNPHFSKGQDPFESVRWVVRDAVIIGADGKEKFRQDDVEVPEWWNETTINIVAEKYFRVINGVKERSAKQMFHRVAAWIAQNGIQQGILEGLATPDIKNEGQTEIVGPARIFYNELVYMFVNGMHAFNSPVWFNAGVLKEAQCSACFIQSVDDTMDSIVDLARREVMLFKGGSGTGSNLSKLRSSYEKLSGGGRPSGPVSFMKYFDKGAGVTKSGGTTRRAAKMVVLNVDHPDILTQKNGEPGFIKCKSHAEKVAQDLYSTGKYTAEWNIPGNVYDLVDYQNANNSVRVTDEFMEAVDRDGTWKTKKVGDGSPVTEYKAREIWREMAEAAWICGDPGVQFDTATNEWHTCKESGRINASNPCSEYLFLDDTACNLSSTNLTRFAHGREFDVAGFEHACEIATAAKEIIVEASSYPSETIRDMSHRYRTLGLGYTNLGSLLTLWGLPYDSNEGRAVAGAITAIMTGSAYRMSAELARVKGPFPEYAKNKDSMLGVIRKHWDAAKRLPSTLVKEWQPLVERAYEVWRDAYEVGKLWGYRNAQVSVIAPTGTISFLMGADTTGIEPMLGCVVVKKVVGEGLLVLPSRIIEQSLVNLGYRGPGLELILAYVREKKHIHGAPGLDPKHNAVFAEALGDFAISPQAHVDMMIAVQPFISGGISKTVNMPETATVADIENVYMRAWRGGLKCVAAFRNNCKLSQPIATSYTSANGNAPTAKLEWGQRKKLPSTRTGAVHKFEIAGVEGYLTPGFYEDGHVAEIFLRMAKAGSTLNGLLESFAIAVSVALQHGAPLEVFVDKYSDMKFEPAGFTRDDDIRMAKSVVDYVFRWLEHHYGGGKKAAAPVNDAQGLPISKGNLDGPPCTSCGNLTKRAGSCYLCVTCGSTTGCS